MKLNFSKTIGGSIVIILLIVLYFYFAQKYSFSYSSQTPNQNNATTTQGELTEPVRTIKRIKTPDEVKGIYMTSWIASTPSLRTRLIALIDETEINSVVIDIKDDTGKISFLIDDELIKSIGSAENRIRDIKGLIDLLHEKNIYVIGRIAVFQDPYLATYKKDIAVLDSSTMDIWKDRKGLSWVDASSEYVWNYIARIAEESYEIGFDEINFDYVRFPTDGDQDRLHYQLSKDKEKSSVIESFFAFLSNTLRSKHIPISADIFGMTTTVSDDLGIGQQYEKVLPHFDFISPMIYPSHYTKGFNGYSNPAAYPYETITYAMTSAISRAVNASSSPEKLRPWLQDFDLGAEYTPDMVRAQIRALNDLGIRDWLLWDASNHYTRDALLAQ